MERKHHDSQFSTNEQNNRRMRSRATKKIWRITICNIQFFRQYEILGFQLIDITMIVKKMQNIVQQCFPTVTDWHCINGCL